MSTTNSTKKQTQATILMKIIETATLIRDDAKQTYAVGLTSRNSNKVIPLLSEYFAKWLQNSYFTKCSTFSRKSELSTAIEQADFLAEQLPSVGKVNFRFGFASGNHYIDMRNEADEIIEITRLKWSITQKAPVYFREFDTQRSLPTPNRNGDLTRVFDYINVEHEEDKVLLLPTVCTLALANLTRPIIGFIGEHGSAKTTSSRIIRGLLDPSDPAENDFTPTKQNLSLVFYHNALPIFDNLSTISSTVSDMFCRAYSGTGFQSRKLYHDYALASFSYKRSFLFTAIKPPTAAADFNDRTVMIQLNRIAGSVQLGEEDLMNKFVLDAPSILGGMLDVLVEAKRIAPGLILHWKPRWADAFQHAAAVAEVLGYGANRYLEACRENLASRTAQEPHQRAAISKPEPTLDAILSLMSSRGYFTGRTSDLLAAITPYRPTYPGSEANWPDSPEKLGKALSRIKATLEEAGVAYVKTLAGNGVKTTLAWLTPTDAAESQSAVVPDAQCETDQPTFEPEELGGVTFEDMDYDAMGPTPEINSADLPEGLDPDGPELAGRVLDQPPLNVMSNVDTTMEATRIGDVPGDVPSTETTTAPATNDANMSGAPKAAPTEELGDEVCKHLFHDPDNNPCCKIKGDNALWGRTECDICEKFELINSISEKLAKPNKTFEDQGLYKSAFSA